MWVRSRRDRSEISRKSAGFTLVELIVVIVVIAILAILTVLAYKDVTQNAHNTTLQSDLTESTSQLTIARAQAKNHQFPQSGNGTLTISSGDTLGYNVSADGTQYCLIAAGWGTSYFVTETITAPQVGSCNGTTSVPGVIGDGST